MKKTTKKVAKVVEETVEAVQEVSGGIAEITHEFGRQDLNELRDTINEIIRKIN